MRIDDCYQIGRIVKPHGLKGAMSIIFDVDDIEPYMELESVLVLQGNTLVPFFIEQAQWNGDRGIFYFEEVLTLEEAELLRKAEVYLPLSSLPKLIDPSTFYYHEIIGFKVVDDDLGDVGTVKSVIEGGGQDLVVMLQQSIEILIPVSDATTYAIDREAKVLKVDLPDGLIELYTDPKAGLK